MKTLLSILTLIFVIHSVAHAEDKNAWTNADTALQVATTGLIAVDWLQTRDIARRPQQYYETNAILGRHPSVERVDAYFAISLVGNAVISYLLPQEARVLDVTVYPRKMWQSFWIGVEAGYVVNNFSMGVRMSF